MIGVPLIKLSLYGEAFGFYREYSFLFDFNIRLVSNRIIEMDKHNEAYNAYILFKENEVFPEDSHFSIFQNMKYASLFSHMITDGYEVVKMNGIDLVCKQEIDKIEIVLYTCDHVLSNREKFGIVNDVKRLKCLMNDLKKYYEQLPVFFRKKYTEVFV